MSRTDKVLKAFKGFNKKFKLTVAKFDKETPQFLDLAICPIAKSFKGFKKKLKLTVAKFDNPQFLDLAICPIGLTIFWEKKSTLDTSTWSPLLYGNRKQTGTDYFLIEQRKYAQKKTFWKKSNKHRNLGMITPRILLMPSWNVSSQKRH